VFNNGSCSNLTDPPGILGLNVNGALLKDAIDECTPVPGNPPSCEFGLSIVTFFDPLNQEAPNGGAVKVGIAESCVDADGNVATTNDVTCTLSDANLESATYQSVGAPNTCLSAHPNTTGPGNVGQYKVCVAGTNTGNVCTTNGQCGTGGVCAFNLTVPTGPCAVSSELAGFGLEFGGLSINLENVQVAAEYQGALPATGLVDGLLRGFLPENIADQIKLDLGALSGGLLNGGKSLSQLLAGPDKCDGGTRNGLSCTDPFDAGVQCPPNGGDTPPQCAGLICNGGVSEGLSCATDADCPLTLCRISCAPAGGPGGGTAQDDRDENPPDPLNDNKSGWWFYLNVTANRVNHVVVP